MRVLGVDPSLHITGYGVVERNGAGLRLLEGGTITPGKGSCLSERLAELQRGIEDVISTFRPDVMIVEEVFARTAYPRTAILMAHARGALVCAAAIAGLPVHDYAATAVKRALVGRGAATKDQVAAMVVQALKLRKPPAPADVTDALALAIAYLRRTDGR
ncbi:MAG: crossover junction endodeoxyribonuclease RuvC [Candidatus Eremiobacterales bacterium]|jgi:crossover junction endodeoxyribonuclease RuvC